MLKALENEPEDRYPDALECAVAFRDGLEGVPPPATAATRMMRDETAATRVAPREPRTPAAPVPAPQPRRRPQTRPAPVIQTPQQTRSRSSFSRFMRGLGAVLLIAIVAAIVAAVILLATDAGSNTDVGDFLKDEFRPQVDAIRDFLDQNTGN